MLYTIAGYFVLYVSAAVAILIFVVVAVAAFIVEVVVVAASAVYIFVVAAAFNFSRCWYCCFFVIFVAVVVAAAFNVQIVVATAAFTVLATAHWWRCAHCASSITAVPIVIVSYELLLLLCRVSLLLLLFVSNITITYMPGVLELRELPADLLDAPGLLGELLDRLRLAGIHPIHRIKESTQLRGEPDLHRIEQSVLQVKPLVTANSFRRAGKSKVIEKVILSMHYLYLPTNQPELELFPDSPLQLC